MKKTGLLLILLLLYISCEHSTGIFFSLQNVVKIEEDKRGLVEQASIKSFLSFKNHYYLTTTTLHMRKHFANDKSSAGYSWTTVKHPQDYPQALKVDSWNNTLIAHFSKDSNEYSASLFQSKNDILYADAGSAQWSEIEIEVSLNPEDNISNFFVQNDELFIEVRRQLEEVFSYRLIHIPKNTGVNTQIPLPITQEMPLPFIDAKFDGTQYWFISVNKIFYSVNDSNLALRTVDTNLSPFIDSDGESLIVTDTSADIKVFAFSSLETDSSNNLYLSTQKGYLFKHNKISEIWSVTKNEDGMAIRFADFGTNYTRFTDILAVPETFNGTEELLIASANEGYSKIDLSNDNIVYLELKNDSESNNFFSTILHNGHIASLYYSKEENNLFALSPRNSLWRAAYDSSTGYLTWKKE